MKRIHLLVLAAAVLAAACATQAPPSGALKSKLDKVYDGDHGEWLKHESAADRNLDLAHAVLTHMENDQYWNITQMQQRADAAAATALAERQKAEEVHMRILDKRLHHLDSMHVTEAQAVMAVEALALFRTGSATPSKVDQAGVREVAKTLRRYPVGFAEVRAYTDTVGSTKSNDKLAAARANNVASMLRHAGAERIATHVVPVPMGEAEGPDNTANAHNRRVDVMVFPHGKGPR
jgi:flagellar motor protein MotB